MPVRPALQRIDVDVAIVGFGPVGQALAALLGRAGHSVLAVERFAERMAAALRVDKHRRPTRPSKGAKERRLADKRRLSERKRARRPDHDD